MPKLLCGTHGKKITCDGTEKYRNCFQVTTHEDCLNEPLSWKKPQIIFVCSMSDLFHKDVPDEFIIKVFDVMNKAKWHTFQVLTKRAERLEQIAPKLKWTKNIWLGVTVESDKQKQRIPYLINTPAHIKYLSIEPLITEIKDLSLDNINWVGFYLVRNNELHLGPFQGLPACVRIPFSKA